MKLKFATALFLVVSVNAFARDLNFKEQLNWSELKQVSTTYEKSENFFHFDGAQLNAELDYLPEYTKRFAVGSNEEVQSVKIINSQYEVVQLPSNTSIKGLKKIKQDLNFRIGNTIERKKRYGSITFVPLRRNKNTGQIEKLVAFELVAKIVSGRSVSNIRAKRQKSVSTSVLATGDWYKIGVTNDGVYKLSYRFLENMGMDMSLILPQNIRIYGNGGGMLPESNAESRYDDLQENAIVVVDGNDGRFDKNDYVLFYGQSPHRWKFSSSQNIFLHETHRYSDTTYYFITADLGPGKRIFDLPSSSLTKTTTVTTFNDYGLHEVDKINLVKSGRDWFGEVFDAVTSYDFTFDFPNVAVNTPIHLRVRVAAKAKSRSSFTVTAEGNSINIDVADVSFNYPSPGGAAGFGEINFQAKKPSVNVNVAYQKNLSSSKGWLDFIELNARRQLVKNGIQFSFRDANSVGNGQIAEFVLTGGNSNTLVWDVTDPLNVRNQQSASTSNNAFIFKASANELREYIAFTDYLENVRAVGRVENQNLHAWDQQDMLIISHPLFKKQADQLAEFHKAEGLRVAVATTYQIFNEFSSGVQDLIGIRDFLKMFYDRAGSNEAEMPKYALMFGDGSYDNKHRISGNTNFVSTYQSVESFSLTTSYVSDDYFGLLDEQEGSWQGGEESVDIGFGRFPVQTIEEAQNVVNKIIHYKTPSTMRDWRNVICYVGDDEDGALHMDQADSLADLVRLNQPEYNRDKIFLDAYQQVSTPGGQRYPDVKVALNKRVEQGALILNYTGHGGETGWAHEAILEVPDILSWSNADRLPLFLTATCEFSRFDDPKRVSGGEHILLNPNGGGIGLFTTVRTVYAGDNFRLNIKFYQNIFNKVNNKTARIGDIFRKIKNENNTINTRNFTLLGDPALELNFPVMDVQTTSINGNSISITDTIRALDKMTISGYVSDKAGNKLSNYNGVLYPTIFDKAVNITTLNNDDEGDYIFDLQKNKLFKGKASIKNGAFSFSFIVPKDINYEFGNGKISYYGENGHTDANGMNKNFIIGGTSKNALADNTGPQIELFMNDETFIFGGITDENPVLLAKLYDEHGINMVGTGLGHDITAVLDKNTEDAVVLNDFYEADIDSYQSGALKYPFSDLKEGKHTLTLKAWDVYNNSAEQSIEFVVEKSKEIEIANVLNYPNPFTTRTEFWFEHNQPRRLLDVRVQIFTISGKLIKTIDRLIQTDGFGQNQINPIVWNGRDEYGDKIGRGVYLYKLKVRSRNNGSMAEKIEKLVIL